MGRDEPRKAERWEEIFIIVQQEIKTESKGLLGFIGRKETECKWALVDKRTSEVVGRYEDRLYALKQARYKYKKVMNKIDKILLR